MPVPTTIDQLSTTAASNYPSGSDSPATLDDVQRAHASFIAQIRDGVQVTNASAKTTPVDADYLPINDSAASNLIKKVTWTNIKATLKTYFDTLYAAVGSFAASGANADITSLGAVTGVTPSTLDDSTKLVTSEFVRNFRQLAQIQQSLNGTFASGTTLIPYDNTIPQSTEGDQYYSAAITPLSASSLLEIEVVMQLSASGINQLVATLFKDSETGARCTAASNIISNANQPAQVVMKYWMTAGSTSAMTFKVRAGATISGTLYVNGQAGAGLFGGTCLSGITIKEYLP